MKTLITPKRTSQKAARYRGVVLVETAFVIILLLMLTLGMMGFGYLFWRAQQITTAARHGARLACVEGANPADVTAIINNYLTTQAIEHDAPVINIGICPGDPVTVTITATELDPIGLRNIPLFGTGLFPDSYTASVTMAKEGSEDCP